MIATPVITNLKMDGDNAIGRAKLIDTPTGKIAMALLDAGIQLGVSSRGVGSLEGDVVNDDYRLLAVDIVAEPSAPEAYVEGILEGKEYILSKNDPLLFFIQRLRDEAHRFAISTHRAKRKKNLSKSLLDQIQGIGKQRKRALLNYFGSARSVESASFDDLKSVEGIEDNIAKKIYNYFHE